MRVLLVQMPFFALDSPSISLALIRAALEEAGHECRIEYFNLELGARIGPDLYTWIAGDSPTHLMLGDLIFAPALQDNDLSLDRLRSLIAPPGTPGVAPVPEEIIQAFPELIVVSRRFLTDVFQETPWSDYDLVGFSTMFTIAPALALAKLVKTLPTPPPVILGGSYCEDEMGEQLLRSFPFLDFVCRGEGERLIVELAAHLSGNCGPCDDIGGLLWRDEAGQVHINAPRRQYPGKATLAASGIRSSPAKSEPHHQLDELPVPTYGDWLQQVRSRKLRTVEQIRLPIQTSRGCWYGEKHHCTFCGLNDATIGYRSKSPERVVHEFRELMKLDVTAVDCVDDILDFRYFATVLPELAKLRHGLEIFYEIKANLSYEQVKLLKEAGIVWLQPGIESLCTPLLQLMDKGVTAFQNVRLLRYASELGVGIAWNLLYGFPGEDPKWFEDMAKLVPALSHLEPPFIDCSHIRLHRFSPLFVNSNSAGLRDVRPCPSYFEFYPFDSDVVARMAYYFEHDYVSQPQPDSYIGELSETVRRWHEEVGVAAFLSVDEPDAVYLIDTRRLASVPRAVLRGLEREVFQACVHGARAEALPGMLSRDENEILRVIELFKERHWVLELDGKLLTLAVPMDQRARQMPQYLPASLRDDSLIELHCRQIGQIHRPHKTEAPSLETLTRTFRANAETGRRPPVALEHS